MDVSGFVGTSTIHVEYPVFVFLSNSFYLRIIMKRSHSSL